MRARRTQSRLVKAFNASAYSAKRLSTATRPFSIRLSKTERQLLEQEAGAQSLGTYVRARLLDGVARHRTGTAPKDTAAISQVLGKLGRLQLSSNFADLVIAARAGAIAMTPELERELQTACQDVREMRDLLMRALGFKPEVRA